MKSKYTIQQREHEQELMKQMREAAHSIGGRFMAGVSPSAIIELCDALDAAHEREDALLLCLVSESNKKLEAGTT